MPVELRPGRLLGILMPPLAQFWAQVTLVVPKRKRSVASQAIDRLFIGSLWTMNLKKE